MSEYSLSCTLKAGTDYDSPWVVVYGNTPGEVEAKLRDTGGLIAAVVEAANTLKATWALGPVQSAPASNTVEVIQHQQAPIQQQVQQAAPQGWGQPQQPVQQQAPAAPQQAVGKYGAQLHPEGKQCHCGQVLQYSLTRTNKGQFKCPAYRYNNGNPNGHDLEWV